MHFLPHPHRLKVSVKVFEEAVELGGILAINGP